MSRSKKRTNVIRATVGLTLLLAANSLGALGYTPMAGVRYVWRSYVVPGVSSALAVVP